jgi:UDP-N-acetylmuramate: L-alanyl-gamma-D-glutamyl-meso-diaminopimelate ligase
VSALRGEGHAVRDVDALVESLRGLARDGDHVVFMSNGGFDGAPRRFLAALRGVQPAACGSDGSRDASAS